MESIQKSNKYLIVNADDFGMSAGINKGIIHAHRYGIVTSTSLMVRWPAAMEASLLARKHPNLSVGLHVDLGEWIYRNDSWEVLYEVVPLQKESAIAAEIGRQLDTFSDLMERTPTHIDSHQHVHMNEPILSMLLRHADELRIPLRCCTSEIRYCGDFYGQTAEGISNPEAISVDNLKLIVAQLGTGITELCCHPGDGSNLDTMYCSERAREVESLCHPHVRDVITEVGIKLSSFTDIMTEY